MTAPSIPRSTALRLTSLGFGALLGWWLAGPPMVRAETAPLAIATEPLPLARRDPSISRVGSMTYLGGLVLRSDDRRFGGLSGLLWEDRCQRLLAVSDTGAFVILQPVESEGRLTGVAEAWIAAIRNISGQEPETKSAADAEALVRTDDGATHVWFERRNAVQRYAQLSACQPESLDAAADSVVAPAAMQDWPANGGPEAAAPLGDGQIVLAEDLRDAQGHGIGLILAPDGNARARLTVAWPQGFLPTSMQRLHATESHSRYLVLLRMFSPMRGIAARLVVVDVPHTGGHIAPAHLAELRAPVVVDNMEGLALRREGGRLMIYLISDNNFNSLQRNLLMKFALPEGIATAPLPR